MATNHNAGKGQRRAYWLMTGLLAFGMVAGGIAQLIQAKPNVEGMIRLGYPLYVLPLLGLWKLIGTAVLLRPGLLLAKEWAYAGFFFLLSGAVVSHIAAGDAWYQWIAPFIFALLTLASWFLRPADRRLATTGPRIFTSRESSVSAY